MINITKKEIEMSSELVTKLKWACGSNYKATNGCLRIVDHTNIAYVEPHKVIINNILFLMFNEDKETIKFYQENNTALSIRNKTLSKKVEEQSNRIEKLEEENFGLKQTIRYFKDKFNKLKRFLQEKLFG